MTHLDLLNIASALAILAKTKNGPQTTLAIARLRAKVSAALQRYFNTLHSIREAAGLKDGEEFVPDSSEAKAVEALLHDTADPLGPFVPLQADAAAAAASVQEKGGDALVLLLEFKLVADDDPCPCTKE